MIPRNRLPMHPGKLLGQTLEEMSLTQAQMAKRLAVSYATINNLIHEKRGMTAELAVKLARELKTTPRLWMDLQTNRDVWLAEHGKKAPGAPRLGPTRARRAGERGGSSMRCVMCKEGTLKEVRVSMSLKAAGHTFVAKRVGASRCQRCGEEYYPGPVLERMDLLAAAELSRAGKNSGEVLRFMRKAVGMKAVDLAKLMGRSPEHVSLLENGDGSVDAQIMALLGAIVLDAIEGRTSTRDAWRAQQKPTRLTKSVSLDMGEA